MQKLSSNMLAATYTVIASILLAFASFYKTDAEVYLFPRITAVLIAALSLILLFDAIRIKSTGGTDSQVALFGWSNLLPGLVIGLVYVLMLEKIGFYICSFLAFLMICIVYGRRNIHDPKAFLYKLMVTSIFMTILYILFWKLLHVRTPTGWFF